MPALDHIRDPDDPDHIVYTRSGVGERCWSCHWKINRELLLRIVVPLLRRLHRQREHMDRDILTQITTAVLYPPILAEQIE